MIDLLAGLNEAQKQAVITTEGIVRVIAGAGSGKTRALTHRFAYLVEYAGISPGHILCVTFTNKAAAEMRTRIHRLTGDNDTGYINTFHGFCVSVLQEESFAVRYPKSFLVLDNSDIDQMLGIIYEERGLTLSDMTFGDARDMIEMKKLRDDPSYYLRLIEWSAEDLRAMYLEATGVKEIIFYGYLYQQKKCFGLDYNDLLLFTLYIFHENEDIRLKWQQRLEYIMIDEFQDIDQPQYELMRVLAGYHRNLFIVGDPDQTIYTWRGASVKFLLDFDREYPDCQTIMMMENYRSTPEIIAVCNSLIAANKDRLHKDLIPRLPSGTRVLCHYAKDAAAEAAWIREKIQALHESGIPYRHITCLYRAHYMTRSLEDAFREDKLPYEIYSGLRFFDRAEIKDSLAYLRLIALQDDLSFLRVVNVPRRNIGKKRVAYLREYAEENSCTLFEALLSCADDELFRGTGAHAFLELVRRFKNAWQGQPISEVLTALLDQSGYERMLRTEGSQERLDNIAELKQSIYEFETSCGEECDLPYYLSHVAMFTNSDAYGTGEEATGADAAGEEAGSGATDASVAADKVKLMTIHAAKGLEFPYVFLCCLNEGAFPTRKTITLEGMEEERRLAFVAMTRAEKALFLSTAEGRDLDGAPRYPSRFLLDIDESLLDLTHKPREGLIQDARAYIEASARRLPSAAQSRDLLDAGTRISHLIFGEGTVLAADPDARTYLIQFDQLDTPRAISFRVKLERI